MNFKNSIETLERSCTQLNNTENNVCAVNRYMAPLLPKAVLVVFLAVIIPRMLLFVHLGGELPLPSRDQPLYIRMAGSVAHGNGFSFSRQHGMVKNFFSSMDNHDPAWVTRGDYVFGLTPVETPTAIMEPGYPLVLGIFFRIFGAVSGSVFSLNLLFALGGAFAVRKLVMDVWGADSGLMAAILWAFYPPYVYYSSYAMTETAHFAMLAVSSMLVLSAARGNGNGFLAGLATGLFFLIRATSVFLIPLQLIYFAWRRRWKPMLFLSLGFAVSVSPWVARNWISMGEPVLMPTKGAVNLLTRNDPEGLASEGICVPDNITVHNHELLEFPSLDSIPGELARSRAIAGSARTFIARNPRLIGWLVWHRAIDFMAPGGSTLGQRGTLAGFVFYPLMLFGLIGLWRNRHHPEAVFLFALFLTYLAVHALAHGGVRYRLPVDVVFLIGAALGTCCTKAKR